MALEKDIVDVFHKGETVSITLKARNPDGNIISSPLDQEVYFTLSDTPGGTAIYTGTKTGGDVVVTDEDCGKYLIQVLPASLTAIADGTEYFYNVWTGNPPGVLLLQAKGKFKLQESIES